MNFLGEPLSHVKNIAISVSLIGSRAQEQRIRHCNRNDIFKHPHIVGAALEAMLQYKQVHPTVFAVESGRIYLGLQGFIILDFEGIGYSALTLPLHKALFEDEGGILIHAVRLSFLLALDVVNYNIYFFYRLEFGAIKFHMHFYNFSCLFGNYVIELACEVFRGEAEVLGEDNVSKDVLAVAPLNPVLVLSCQVLVHSSRLENDKFKNAIVHFK